MSRPEDERLDLSPLDPTLDVLCFERIVRSVALRASASSRTVMVGYWKVALALAASAAIAAWTPWLLSRSRPQTTTRDSAESLLEWASRGGPSSVDDVLDSFGRQP